MVGTINIRIEGQHGSISDLEWRDVPPFAVLTGVNGAGKSQLLEILAASHNALRSRAPRSDPPAIQARAHIEDDSFSAGEVFHSYGEWPLLAAGGATEDQVKGAIRELSRFLRCGSGPCNSGRARWTRSNSATSFRG